MANPPEVEPNRDGEKGNTKPSRKQPPQLKQWFFTWNNYPNNAISALRKVFDSVAKKYRFQLEVGEQGTPHIQGMVILKNRMRWNQFHLPKEIHWEKMLGSIEEAYDYCSKSDTRDENVDGSSAWEKGFGDKVIVLKPRSLWGLKIEELLKFTPPNGRTVHWFYDTKGGQGKSAFCKYMYVLYKIPTIQGGKMSDVINIIFNLEEIPKMIIFDLPRKTGNKISESAIECILNGMITNTKFETGVRVFNPPHVVVFSNEYPNVENMSMDRWKITNISNVRPFENTLDDMFNFRVLENDCSVEYGQDDILDNLEPKLYDENTDFILTNHNNE